MSIDRFKFRAWNTTHNMYHDFEDLAITLDGKLLDRDRQIYDQGEYSIEQCTGLKDRNGKLIYEGDVVEYYDPLADDHYQGVVTFDDNETTASGYYIKGNRKGRWDSYLDGSHCRIIGNVHETEK